MKIHLLVLALVGLVSSQLPAQTVISQVPGAVGQPTDFSAPGTLTVGADGKAAFQVNFDPLLITVPDTANPFVYTTTVSWSQAVDIGGVTVNEWVRGANGEEGNLAAFGIQPGITVTGASSGASFPAIPFPIVSYEVEVTGLQSGDVASFVKVGSGGLVVPEPASLTPMLLGILGTFAARRRVTMP